FYRDTAPDLVISGVNSGANVGDAVQYSATVGAALTAAHLGWPAVALSQAFTGSREDINWSASELLAADYIRQCLRMEKTACWNINFPNVEADAVQGYRYCKQAEKNIASVQAKLSPDGRGINSYWLAFNKSVGTGEHKGSDINALLNQKVAIMPLLPHRTDADLLEALAASSALSQPIKEVL